MKKAFYILLIVSVFISLYLFLRSTDIHASISLLKQLNGKVVYIIFCTFLAYISGTLGWKYCIDTENRLSLWQLFMYRHIGNTITLFNPTSAIAGEWFNAHRLIREGVTEQAAYQSVLLSRMIMILSQLILFSMVITWFLLSLSDQLSGPIKYILFAGIFTLLVICFLIAYVLLKDKKDQSPVSPKNRWEHIALYIKKMRTSLGEYIHHHPEKVGLAFSFLLSSGFAAPWNFIVSYIF